MKESTTFGAQAPVPAPPASASPNPKLRVAQISLFAAIGMLVFKLLVGLHTHSLGILAEAAHSALDLLATVLTWVSLRIAARPADANHPFGHGKFESISAFIESGLLIVTGVIVVVAAVLAWIAGAARSLHVDGWAFAVMLTSIAVDWNRARLLSRTADQYQSDALAADALNFRTDLATSTAVLVGLGLVWLGQLRHLAWLLHADAVAACLVAAAMLALAVRLGRRMVGVLSDETPPALARDLQSALAGVEGVDELERLRLRRVGNRYFVDLQVALDPASTFEKAGQVRQALAERIQHRLPEADVVVETQPRRLAPLGPFEQVQAIAQRQNLNIHDLAIYDVGGQLARPGWGEWSPAGSSDKRVASPGDAGPRASQLDLEFHLELGESLPLAEAHNRVSALEAAMRRELPAVREIVTHIEPESAHIASADLLDPQRLARRLQRLAGRQPEVLDCHDIQLRRGAGHLTLSCHCTFADHLPLGRVHELSTRLEADIKRAFPELYRVTIHPEPGSDNRR